MINYFWMGKKCLSLQIAYQAEGCLYFVLDHYLKVQIFRVSHPMTAKCVKEKDRYSLHFDQLGLHLKTLYFQVTFGGNKRKKQQAIVVRRISYNLLFGNAKVTLIDDSLMYNKIFLAMIIGNKKQFDQYVIREIIYFKLFKIS